MFITYMQCIKTLQTRKLLLILKVYMLSEDLHVSLKFLTDNVVCLT